MGQEIAERVKDRHLTSVLRHQHARGLDHMRVPADDQVRAAVGKHLRPGAFIVVRAEGSLLAPVGKDDDKIGRFFRARQIVSNVTKRSTIQAFPGAPPLSP